MIKLCISVKSFLNTKKTTFLYKLLEIIVISSIDIPYFKELKKSF